MVAGRYADNDAAGRVKKLQGIMMMRAIRLLAGSLALVAGIWAAEAGAVELKVLSAGAMRAALQELAPAFEAASGNNLKI